MNIQRRVTMVGEIAKHYPKSKATLIIKNLLDKDDLLQRIKSEDKRISVIGHKLALDKQAPRRNSIDVQTEPEVCIDKEEEDLRNENNTTVRKSRSRFAKIFRTVFRGQSSQPHPRVQSQINDLRRSKSDQGGVQMISM